MTMTPARAASIFASRRPGAHGDQGKEALPWWFFALLGGLATMWWLPGLLQMEDAAANSLLETALSYLRSALFFAPGAIAGGVLGWLIIRPVNWVLGRLFRGFNAIFDRATAVYGKTVGWSLRLAAIVLIGYVGLVGLTGFGFTRVPAGFIPSQDKGRLIVNVQLPDSASLERTMEVTRKMDKIALETPGIAHTLAWNGRSFVLGNIGSNLATMFVTFEPFHDRRDPIKHGDTIAATLRERFRKEIPEARISVFGAPAVEGLGSAGGFRLMIQAIGDVKYDALQAEADKIAANANKQPGIVGAFNGFRAETPQLFADIDRTKAKTMNVPLTDIFDTLQVYLGGYYVNDFNRFGRTWQVNIQADPSFRVNAEMVKNMKVRNGDGDMAPLGAVVNIRDAIGRFP
jgi:multidrug efflux pump